MVVNLLKVFLLMCFLGGAGGALGSMAGNTLGRGGVFAGGFLGGAILVIAGGLLAMRWQWIKAPQKVWTILGALFGFGMAAMVTITTLSSPLGPILSTLLIGTGAVLGARVGWSAHEQP